MLGDNVRARILLRCVPFIISFYSQNNVLLSTITKAIIIDSATVNIEKRIKLVGTMDLKQKRPIKDIRVTAKLPLPRGGTRKNNIVFEFSMYAPEHSSDRIGLRPYRM